MKVLTVIGTRPEAIKMAPIIRQLEGRPRLFTSRVCVTGQHREMLDPMLSLFGIKPDHDLSVMRPGQGMTDTTAAVLVGMERVLKEERPDWVLVQGDTTTVMATSLASYWQHIAVGHVEAGLRTFNKYSPFPEEVNRRIAGVVADLHFCPTEWAADNLRREGVPEGHICVTGNTVIDSLHRVTDMPFDPSGSPLADVPFDTGLQLVLVTAHRHESFGDGMKRICLALRALAQRYPRLHLVYPVHLNPKARKSAFEHLDDLDNVSLLPPLEYQPLVWLLNRVHFVLTDSGGLQEEAAGVGKPVLVLRDTTERPEGVHAGMAKLVGARHDEILGFAGLLLEDDREYHAMASAPCPYGDGTAAEKIVEALIARRGARRAEDAIYEHPAPVHPLDLDLQLQRDTDDPVARSTEPAGAVKASGRFKRRRRGRVDIR